MKILTLLGTRPEIIRLSRIIPLLDKICDHQVVHTGQNYSPSLNRIFFEQLKLREPDKVLESKSETLMGQVAQILVGAEKAIQDFQPDRLLLLGDTNSALSALVAKRYGIPVFHMEAGNRCFDDRVPEEVNRRVIDHSSDILMPYTENSRQNLLAEGIPGHRILVTGNPIYEVLNEYQFEIDHSAILSQLGVSKQRYFLVTLHRQENVDELDRLAGFMGALNALVQEYQYPLICSAHPRMTDKLQSLNMELHPLVRLLEPMGLFDFVHLEKNAFCVLTDSGTVQEECCIFNVPNVTLRDVTERPETLEVGSNVLSGCHQERILSSVQLATLTGARHWVPPAEYTTPKVSETVAKIMLSHFRFS